ncbi:pyridoxal phosphate-dependent decarboxylase family protein [Halotalea alkalilenta]|uniref:pyridoxal phosphate-dependent decarboxylase family protein n=1 Tax=Halotalea alkalilenta TaxID=376489 RepID=UPI000483AFC6|nr:aminotransferase class V-fold PLP-dependent enzyme [Halotalea alkalilenta]
MDTEEFRRHGHAVIDWLADYHAQMRNLPVQAATEPGSVKALLPDAPPSKGEPFEAILGDMDKVVLPHLSHWQHPRFFGFFPSNSLHAGILGDLMSSGLGVLGLSWQSSPAVTEVEEVVVDWFRQMVGLSPQWFGVINDTASSSTLVALLTARERSTDYALARAGLQDGGQRLVVYTSVSAHSSVMKAALLCGFGRENVRLIDVDEVFAMRADALEQAIVADLAAGLKPCAIVAAVGGTATTSFDPVDEIAEIAQKHGVWLHVDAAMAGSAMILPEYRWMWNGIEGADSVVINAHKWLGVPFDCSLYFVRDEPHLLRVMSTNPTYLQSETDGVVRNLRDTSIPLGRRFRALKLWFVIREQGVDGLQARLRRDLKLATELAEEVSRTPHWQVVAPVALQTVCVRFEPPGIPEGALDEFTRAWASAVNKSGEAFVTPATAGGKWMVRVSIGAPETTDEDVRSLWSLMQSVSADIASTLRTNQAGA